MSLSRALDPEPTMADLIESGRHFYANKEYNRALELFRRNRSRRSVRLFKIEKRSPALEDASARVEACFNRMSIRCEKDTASSTTHAKVVIGSSRLEAAFCGACNG
ncbi:hypothetical protein E4U56_002190 [Claviceps arundinis]|uniref:Uncharacterized protein n=1 Tax=Claviceps arundinis TaxID=1623583 RepID=A0A9P7SMD3_9HYPO|nr:hypothetical protein E4U56_002190 [Claviceps arundinis]